jgi:hypothetical protein
MEETNGTYYWKTINGQFYTGNYVEDPNGDEHFVNLVEGTVSFYMDVKGNMWVKVSPDPKVPTEVMNIYARITSVAPTNLAVNSYWVTGITVGYDSQTLSYKIAPETFVVTDTELAIEELSLKRIGVYFLGVCATYIFFLLLGGNLNTPGIFGGIILWTVFFLFKIKFTEKRNKYVIE